ncbi:MAG: thiamine pyrophosphate-dependent enzyme [Actinomycetota bacterium]|nr:thiamine pyrophosphate-dependent enzyme [Actinomycetota bacterium]
MNAPKIVSFAGAPREPVPVPLASADEFGIEQVLDAEGLPNGNRPEPDLDQATVVKMYEVMVTVAALDRIGWQLQRSGRMEFWIPSRGQEAAHVASTAAMRPSDWIFLADREPGSFLWRGAGLTQMFAQFFGRADEPLKGRRLPLLLGDRSINIVPCTTQVGSYIPHAAGAAWAAKLRGDDTRFIVYFGDGATSRGEFHSALNFAGIHHPPVVFFCQNNGWAVSTPNDRQTATATFAEKADAYAVRRVRVDGNDPLAVYAATAYALAAMPDEGATLIEAVTYRMGFHTSSDNPDLYRSGDEVDAWGRWDPIARTRKYLEHKGWWDSGREAALHEVADRDIKAAITAAEAMPKPVPESQFDDVFEQPTWMLDDQRDRLLDDLSNGGAL